MARIPGAHLIMQEEENSCRRGNRKMQHSRIDETKREFHRAPDTVLSWSIGLTDTETELRGRGVQNAWNNTGPGQTAPWFRAGKIRKEIIPVGRVPFGFWDVRDV